MSLANSIKAVNESARKFHGSDIHIMVARAIHFGNDDNLVIVTGKNHKAAAMDFVKTTPGAVITEVNKPAMDWGDGDVTPASTLSHISF